MLPGWQIRPLPNRPTPEIVEHLAAGSQRRRIVVQSRPIGVGVCAHKRFRTMSPAPFPPPPPPPVIWKGDWYICCRDLGRLGKGNPPNGRRGRPRSSLDCVFFREECTSPL